MIESRERCLEALDALTTPNGERCSSFKPIQNHTGYDRKTVKRNVRALALKGLAEYFRGLTTEDGDFAGAGYCITKTGQAVLSGFEPEPKAKTKSMSQVQKEFVLLVNNKPELKYTIIKKDSEIRPELRLLLVGEVWSIFTNGLAIRRVK